MADVKMTKKDYFAQIKAIVAGADVEGKDELIAFVNKQVEMLDAKAAKAKERAANKKAEGDELREVIATVLTDEFQTADEITAQVEGEDITKAKVVARLTQLVKARIAVKEQIKVDSAKKMAYKLAGDGDADAEEVVEDDAE